MKTKVKSKTDKAAKPEKKAKIVDTVRAAFEANPEIETCDLIKLVKDAHPTSHFNKAHASFYRNRFRAQGMDIPLRRTPSTRVVKNKKAKEAKKAKAAEKTGKKVVTAGKKKLGKIEA